LLLFGAALSLSLSLCLLFFWDIVRCYAPSARVRRYSKTRNFNFESDGSEDTATKMEEAEKEKE